MEEIIVDLNVGNVIVFDYTNWRGISGKRKTTILRYVYGKNKYHQEVQWFIEGFDHNKNDIRYYSLKDMSNIERLSL